MKKKVLLIAYDFLPYYKSLGGVIRAVTLANFLRKEGFQVFVIAKKGEFYSYFGYETYLDKLFVKYLSLPSDILNHHLNKIKIESLLLSLKKRLFKIKHSFLGIFNASDYKIWDIKVFFNESCKLIEKYNIENVIVTTPPHIIQKVGLLLKKKYGENVNLIVDYRDSWNTNKIFKVENKIKYFFLLRLEKKILEKSDYFTFVSNPILNKIKLFLKLDISGKSLLIMNGFEKKIESSKEKKVKKKENKKIKVGYFGSITDNSKAFRNVFKLLTVLKQNKELCKKYEFHFFGNVTFYQNHNAIFNCVKIHSSLSHLDALEKMLEMDYLLLIHSDPNSSDEVITGKFFDYISVRKPIICLSPKEMEAKKIILENKIGIWIDNSNDKEIKKKLEQLYRKRKEITFSYDKFNVLKYQRENQYKEFLKILR